MTPTTPRNCPSKDIEKVTPGGTKLPEGPPPIEKGEREPTPPPMPPVPPLPWGNYEVYNEGGVNKWLGPQPVPMESMHDGMMVVIYKASGTADEVESNKYQIPKRKGSKDLSKNSRIFAKL